SRTSTRTARPKPDVRSTLGSLAPTRGDPGSRSDRVDLRRSPMQSRSSRATRLRTSPAHAFPSTVASLRCPGGWDEEPSRDRRSYEHGRNIMTVRIALVGLGFGAEFIPIY